MQLKYKLLVIALVCAINFVVHIQLLSPDIMEARNLITAREMVEKDNWLNPSMNGYPRLAKPPFPTWVNAAIAKVYPVDNLFAHRIPAAIMGFLMVLAIFFIAKSISNNENIGYYSALTAATSYYLILMSRQATWDIYCHSLMAVAIVFLIRRWQNNKNELLSYSMAGLFMGLSFMSKGPVSFYVVLLPFIISWFLIMKNTAIKKEWRGLLIMLLVFVLVGLSWPTYQLTVNKELLLRIINAESTAWTERHVKPFYQYWGFWSHVGIWSLFAIATLVYPFMKTRVPVKEYKFFFWWLVIMVVLLSIPGEKKERYLLPVIIPLSCLIGYFINYLIKSWQESTLKTADKNLVRVFTVILLVISLAFPFLKYFITNSSDFDIVPFIIFWSISGALIYTLKSLNVQYILMCTIGLMSAATYFGIKNMAHIDNTDYINLSSVRTHSFYEYDFYSKALNPKEILSIGKKVDTLYLKNGEINKPLKKDFILVSYKQMSPTDLSKKAMIKLKLISAIPYDRKNKNDLLYFYLVQ